MKEQHIKKITNKIINNIDDITVEEAKIISRRAELTNILLQEVTFRAEKDDAGRDRAFFVKEFDRNYFYQQKSEEGPVKTLTGIDSNGNN